MTTTSNKTACVFTRVSPELKKQAEDVLDKLQIPMSTALSMFLQQVVEQQGIPFEVKLHHQPLDTAAVTEEQFDQEIKKGFDDFKNGRAYTADQVHQQLRDRNR